MKNYILFLISVFVLTPAFTQLNCKSSIDSVRNNVKKCFHSNKKVSTEEIWDDAKRFGSLHVFSNEGKELAVYYLRTVGGHASVHINYYSNGQVSKIEFSDAPDGGIQFYNSTRRFDERGKQVEFNEMKYPFELNHPTFELVKEDVPIQPVVTKKQDEVIACATIFQTVYQIRNTTKSKLVLTVQPLVNNAVNITQKEIVLMPNQMMNFDTIIMSDQFISAKIYLPEIKKVLTHKRNEKKIKLIEPGPIENGAVRTYFWFVVED